MAIVSEERFWHQLTSLHSGMGRVRLWTLDSPADVDDFMKNANFASAIPFGAGTNSIGKDEDGAEVVRFSRAATPEILSDGRMAVSAGMMLPKLADFAAENGYGGLGALSGIPGAVGGAIAMNAGAHGTEIADFLEEIRAVKLSDGADVVWKRGDGGFGYRRAPFGRDVLVTCAVLRLPKEGAVGEAKIAISQERARRREANPQGPSVGSIFRNPQGDYAGRLLEAAGCKGLSKGALVVSEKHANWILNPTATPVCAADVLWLVEEMRRRVPGLLPEVRLE